MVGSPRLACVLCSNSLGKLHFHDQFSSLGETKASILPCAIKNSSINPFIYLFLQLVLPFPLVIFLKIYLLIYLCTHTHKHTCTYTHTHICCSTPYVKVSEQTIFRNAVFPSTCRYQGLNSEPQAWW